MTSRGGRLRLHVESRRIGLVTARPRSREIDPLRTFSIHHHPMFSVIGNIGKH
jgi:hypothetical protein